MLPIVLESIKHKVLLDYNLQTMLDYNLQTIEWQENEKFNVSKQL